MKARFKTVALAALLGAALALPHFGISQTAPPPPPPPPGQPVAIPPQPGGPPPAASNPLDQPMQVLGEARQAYQNVRDYTCLFVKREQVRGVMQPENVLTMKVRTTPFSVYLRWQAPKNVEGQEACYVAGANNGQMRVHSTGVLGIAGWVSLMPNDPRALETSRHMITEAGIGNLIEKYTERWNAERPLGRTQTRVAEYDFARRRCVRVEAVHPNSKPGEFYSYRAVVYFDKETKLPIRSECYDWPRPGGNPDGDLLECFSYVDMKVNVGLPPEAFKY